MALFTITGLLQIRERPTFDETRLQLVFARDNERYHLYAPSASGELLAMVCIVYSQEWLCSKGSV